MDNKFMLNGWLTSSYISSFTQQQINQELQKDLEKQKYLFQHRENDLLSQVKTVEQQLQEKVVEQEIIKDKLSHTKDERDKLKIKNKELENEIIMLQNHIKQMAPSYVSNTSDSFPLVTELQQKCYEFFRSNCQDLFFDVLCEISNIQEISRFYKELFTLIQQEIYEYFEPSEILLVTTACFSQNCNPLLDRSTPLRSVLNKSYQTNYQKIYKKCFNKFKLKSIIQNLISQFSCLDEEMHQNDLMKFIGQASDICLMMRISEPQFSFDINEFCQQDQYSQVRHESMDGFLKSKEHCIIILPAVFKVQFQQLQSKQDRTEDIEICEKREIVVKASVLSLSYTV